jgi:hypothetical protein
MNQLFYDQVKTADQKAGYICTFLTILFAYSKDRGKVLVFLSEPPSFSPSWLLSLVFALAACYAITCTALVVLPRVKAGGSTLFWGSWGAPDLNKDKFMAEIPDDFIKAEYLTNVQNLAYIAQAKYRYVGLAFRGTAATIICYICIVLIIT